MRIFSRYISGCFLKPFLFGMGVFALLIFLGDVFDKLPRLLKTHAPTLVILEYLWLEVPYWGIRVIPMATLLATLYAVTGFVQSGEWIGVQASGFEPRLFFRPLVATAALAALAGFAAQESVLPACYRRAQQLWRERIHPEWEWDLYQDVMLAGGDGRFVTTKLFAVGEGRMEQPVMDYYGEDRIARQVAARRARWDAGAGRWVFRNGALREFRPDGGLRETAFESWVSDLDVPPKALMPRRRDPDEMGLLEMRRYLRQVGRVGGSRREALAALHAKLAFPFSNVVLCCLGIPIALRLGRRSRALSFAVALAVSFLYFWVMEMGRALGAAGRVPPALGAWLANAAFGAAAWRLYRG